MQLNCALQVSPWSGFEPINQKLFTEYFGIAVMQIGHSDSFELGEAFNSAYEFVSYVRVCVVRACLFGLAKVFSKQKNRSVKINFSDIKGLEYVMGRCLINLTDAPKTFCSWELIS